ncbi:Coronin-7, partial [Modicella reniformis]
GTVGRVGQNVHQLGAHGSEVTDWEFSPFDANVLITGSENGEVKIWQITTNDNDPIGSLLLLTIATGTGKPVETIVHHPTTRGVIATASHNVVQIWDISNKEHGSALSSATYTLTHPNAVSSISWKADGTLLGTTCKDTFIRVFDPRQQESPIQTGQGHAGNRPSRVVWLGEKDLIFTQGFNKMREKEIAVRSVHDLSKPLELKRFDSSSGLMLPLYDEDTSMMFIMSRGESTVRWLEIAESAPYMTEGTAFTIPGPVAGVGLVPKLILNVMQTEVVRILALNANGLWPVNVSIPRKSYLDFHVDLYPETKSSTPGLEASQWLQGENNPVPRVSLDPGMEGKFIWQQQAINAPPSITATPSVPKASAAAATPSPVAPSPPISQPSAAAPVKNAEATTSTAQDILTKKFASTTVSVTNEESLPTSSSQSSGPLTSSSAVSPAASAAALRLSTQKTSKFRFLTFKPYHASEHFESISGLSISVSPECSLIEVNPKFMALPLQGSGGRVGILKTTKPGRVVNKIPCLVCSSDLMSFKFDPFNPNLLVTASDDTKIKGWTIPEDEFDKDDGDNDVNKPNWILGSPTMDKISLILFHPRARDVLLSASMDRNDPTLRLWDLKAQKEVVSMRGHKDMIFSCSFNHLGAKIVSVCRDKKIRIWDALTGNILQEGPGHESLRSCRVLWLGESDLIASVGFGRGSQREILLFDAKDLAGGSIDKKLMDNSPGVLVPHYDPDTSLLSVSARGDRVMKNYEILLGSKDDVGAGKSLFVEVANLEQGSLQQDVAYLPKRYCNLREVELAKMYRLAQNSVEVIRVSVPRNKKEFFQDELFPDTVDVETPTMEAGEFFAGVGAAEKRPKKISLCPPDMEPLSHHLAMTMATSKGGGNSLDKFLQGRQQVADDERKRLAMERMFETAKESTADRDTIVPDTGIVNDDEWDD